MDTWPLVDVGVFFTFFLILFVQPLLFLAFWRALRFLLSELPHCVNHSVRTNFFGPRAGFFFCWNLLKISPPRALPPLRPFQWLYALLYRQIFEGYASSL